MLRTECSSNRRAVIRICSECGTEDKIRYRKDLPTKCRKCSTRVNGLKGIEVIKAKPKKGKTCVDCGKFSYWITKEHCKVCRPAISGKAHYNWKGGICSEAYLLRRSVRYRNWRKSVFERDDYTCQICEKRGVYLEADHIKPFAYYPELRFSLDNGRTLCKSCHLNHGWRYSKEAFMQIKNSTEVAI
jgi:5-methylcytosine-specific restriction endonuclease McrA